MVDYIVLDLPKLTKADLEKCGISFYKPSKGFDENTGELLTKRGFNYKWIGEYSNLKFTIDTKDKIKLRGSLHVFWNDGKHNHNDFGYKALNSVVSHLQDKFGIDPEITEFRHLEIGLNIEGLPFPTDCINENLLFHSGKGIPIKKFKYGYHYTISDFKAVGRKFYILKSYDKALQNKLTNNIFRLELKHIRTRRLHKLGHELGHEKGIKTLADLTNPTKIELLKIDYLKKWDEMFLLDWTIREKELTMKERNKLKDWKRPKYWVELSKNPSRNQFSREHERYSKMVQGHSDNVKAIIKDAIIQKWCKITTETKQLNKSVLVQGHSNIMGELALKPRKCTITGIDISTQKPGSKFLRESTLSQIYKNDKFLYQELFVKFGPRSGEILHLEKEFYLISKNIRNQDSNPRLSARYRDQKYKNSLFPYFTNIALYARN